MRTYILTRNERTLLQNYLVNGTITHAFLVLMNRIHKNHSQLREELDIIQKVINKRDRKRSL
jgi:hypothetical protein